MYHHHPHHFAPHHPGPPQHSGLMGVLGGAVNLATSALYGGAGLVRTVVEGTMWHGCHPHHDPCCHSGCGCGHHHDCCSCHCVSSCHCCCIQHVPPLYTGCC
jgi:hypothetical protein